MHGFNVLRVAGQSTRLSRRYLPRLSATSMLVARRSITTEVEPLPYSVEGGLAPLFKPTTLATYYEDHHAKLRKHLAAFTRGTIYETSSLREIITKTANQPTDAVIFNHASQLWNEEFFLKSLASITVIVCCAYSISFRQRIKEHFDTIELFKEHFTNQALTMFGSGWIWLVEDNMSRLRIINTFNAGSPLVSYRMQTTDANTQELASSTDGTPSLSSLASAGVTDVVHPLLCLNLWEHAYVLDHGIAGRNAYINAFWNNIDWNVVQQRSTQTNNASSSYGYGVGGFYGA
ncbi:Manganese/iron superoxide dismutase [Syncephalis plumigaleata]|nr:Manganese/iron superoxide dismutase [Syncephalis plumigaleata]